MNMKYEFNGISTNGEPQRELFTNMYDNTLIKNKSFTVELDDKEVELHIFIEYIDMADYEDSEDHIITIGVVPTFKSLSKKNQDKILSQFMPESIKDLDDIDLTHEGMVYGFNVPLHTVTIQDSDEVEHTLDSAIAVHGAVEGLIGFDLDKVINGIGNTGWDFLNDYCCDKDLISTALGRF